MFEFYLNNYFFFQAEDGIRDKLVTGVQTCALPIFEAGDIAGEQRHLKSRGDAARVDPHEAGGRERKQRGPARGELDVDIEDQREAVREIGRASCRERVEIVVVAGSIETEECLVGRG